MKSKNHTSEDEKIYWAAFYHLGINGEKNLRRLIKKFGNLEEAWEYFCNYTRRDGACPVSTEMVNKIKNFSLEKLKSDLNKFNINLVILDSSDYPAKLKQIKNPPLVLYCICRDVAMQRLYEEAALAVVGTRRATAYGKQALNHILPEIVKRDIAVVSGLARGIDIHAHKITLEHNGKTIAVLAGGLDQIYPPEHKKFAEDIVEAGGAIISEHPPGTQYLRQYFPARNRIISGLSDAVLVVEAKEKSGALITAEFAFSQERKVLAVPGGIFSAQSRGVNSILKKGALPVQEPKDILEALFGRKSRKKHAETHCNASLSEEINLTSDEKEILQYLSPNCVTPLNTIIHKTSLPAAKVISVVTQLEINSLIENLDGGYIKSI